MDKEQKINQMLYEKMAQEQKQFVEELKSSSPEKIIEKAYEFVMREDILLSVEGYDLPISKSKSLLKLDKPLDSIYHEWLDNDYTHMYMVRDTISDCADYHIKYQKEKINKGAER